jgi:hypothetical protein
MYVMEVNVSTKLEHALPSVALPAMPMETWHKRLGHASKDMISKNHVLSGINKEDSDRCEICVQGKLTRKSFPASNSRSSRPLELVLTDLIGKFDPPSCRGAQDVIVFTDDYPRCVGDDHEKQGRGIGEAV